MKGQRLAKNLAAAILAASATLSFSAIGADVGVSVSVGQPGFYGRLDIGSFPKPVLVYPEPVIVRPAAVVYEPIYLHVPPGQAKKWHKYCGHYRACGRPVYFVQDSWYNEVYVPEYRSRHGGPHHKHDRAHDKHHDKGPGKSHDHGHGKGHDKGNGKH